jgi:uncharacterized phage protein gp47/JayE
VANVINPNLSYGVYLDAVCAFLGITRGKNTYTEATGILLSGGASPTTIAAGSNVSTPNGDLFQVLYPVTIPANGTAIATIESIAIGPVPLPIGPLTIVDGTIGWGAASVTDTTVITPGTIALTDAQLKTARNQRLYAQGIGSSGAIQAAALAVPGVTSCQVVENNTGVTGTVNGVTFTLPSALWVCVSGTPNQFALAQALYNAHNGGCPWDYGTMGMGTPVASPNGVLATDIYTGFQYAVKYTTPVMYDVYVNITVVQQTSVATPAESIQNALVTYATGMLTGEPGLVVGANVSAFELAGAIIQQLPGMYVKACMIACVPAGSAAPSYPSDYVYEFTMGTFEQGQLSAGNVTVTPVAK